MQPTDASSVHMVTEPRAIRWLTDVERVQVLALFFGEPVTVGDAAAQFGRDLNWMYKQVKRMERLGLVRLESHKARKGRALSLYRAVADRFVIPPGVVSFEELLYPTMLQLEWPFFLALVDVLEYKHEDGLGLSFSPAGEGEISVRVTEASGDFWDPFSSDLTTRSTYASLSLNPEEAKAFWEELNALYEKYDSRSGAQSYLLRLALVPGTF